MQTEIQGIEQALGFKESEILSVLAEPLSTNAKPNTVGKGKVIVIVASEIETRKDKDQKDYPNAYITTDEGKVYRTSNQAILTKLKTLTEKDAYPVRAMVAWRKGAKASSKAYLDLVEPDSSTTA